MMMVFTFWFDQEIKLNSLIFLDAEKSQYYYPAINCKSHQGRDYCQQIRPKDTDLIKNNPFGQNPIDPNLKITNPDQRELKFII